MTQGYCWFACLPFTVVVVGGTFVVVGKVGVVVGVVVVVVVFVVDGAVKL